MIVILIVICRQVHLHGDTGGPTHDRPDVDHVPKASGALGLEESSQLGEDPSHLLHATVQPDVNMFLRITVSVRKYGSWILSLPYIF